MALALIEQSNETDCVAASTLDNIEHDDSDAEIASANPYCQEQS